MIKRIIPAVLLICICISTPVKAGENDTYICDEYQTYIYEVADGYNVCPELIMAIIEAESSGNAKAINDDSQCKGLMQISEKYHKDRMKKLGVTNLKDPYSNILVGTDYLMELASKNDDLTIVLGTYHGETQIDVNKPSDYVIKIVNRSEELERIHGK